MLNRLDKLISAAGAASRSEIGKAAARGEITVNGEVVTDASVKVDGETAVIVFRGETLRCREYFYFMMNKPAGYITSTDDPREKTVFDLLPPREKKLGLHPAGRLDKDTTGLLILTSDGALTHRVLSPKHHAEKVYAFTAADPLSEEDVRVIEGGVTLADGDVTKPCTIVMKDEKRGEITLTEGKYHEIKRLLGYVGNRCAALKRISFGGVRLDPSLRPGEFRELTPDEEALLKSQN